MFEVVTTTEKLVSVDVPLLVVGAFAAPGDVATDGAPADTAADAGPRPPVLTDGAAAVLSGVEDAAGTLVALAFDGSEGATVRLLGGPAGRMVLVVGLGPAARCSTETLRRAAGAAARAAADVTALATDLAQVPVGADAPVATGREVATAVAEGLMLGAYRFDAYRTAPKPVRLTRAVLAGADAVTSDGLRRGRITARATAWVRDLVNTPPRDKRPAALADLVVAGVADTGVTVRVLDDAALLEGGYGGIMGVGGGSSVKPRLVELRWQPEGARRHVAIVGKGITFDTGGYSLKPTSGMETMKMDMAGAATAAAVVRAAAELELPVAVSAVLVLAENLISGDAQRVSDVVTMRNGTTVEVMNTDAEGRLVLGDGIAHAVEAGADTIVDVATLTGAIVIALGDLIGGLMANDDALAEELLAAGSRSGEPLWRLPLAVDEYGKRVEGTVADLRNVGGREAGSIFGALFLHRFVPKGTRWAHLDIAGTAWRENGGHYHQKGATGTPVRTLIAWLEAIEERETAVS
jgi:leucyl aminopeptidase